MIFFFFFFFILTLIGAYRYYELGIELSNVDNQDKRIYLNGFMKKILYLNKYNSVSLLGFIYQCIAVIPLIISLPFQFYCYICIVKIIPGNGFATKHFILNMFIISVIYPTLVQVVISIIKRINAHAEIPVIEFLIYIPIRFITIWIVVGTLIIMIIAALGGSLFASLIILIIGIALLITIRIGMRFERKYYMTKENLCSYNGDIIPYKSISKITQRNKIFLFGLVNKTLISIEDVKNTPHMIFMPNDAERFIKCLRERCPNAEYMISDEKNKRN